MNHHTPLKLNFFDCLSMLMVTTPCRIATAMGGLKNKPRHSANDLRTRCHCLETDQKNNIIVNGVHYPHNVATYGVFLAPHHPFSLH